MTDLGRLDRVLEEWDRDPEYIVEGVVLRINEHICELMEARGITRAELARRLGKSPAYVTRFLNGQPNMTLKTLTQIAVALGEGIGVFVPSSIREERSRARQAAEEERRAQLIRRGQALWRGAADQLQSGPLDGLLTSLDRSGPFANAS